MNIVLATSNPGKLKEFMRLFRELMPELPLTMTLGSEAGLSEVEETGSTFAENARIKAVAAAFRCGRICLAEDSGLEVDYLGGAPGVKSHRFSPSGLDPDNNRLLLERLRNVPAPNRTARYRSAICVASPSGVIAEAQGSVEGLIADSPMGDNGFGYDPLFYSLELGKTMGQASAEEKDSVSHRRRAMEKVTQKLRESGSSKEGSS